MKCEMVSAHCWDGSKECESRMIVRSVRGLSAIIQPCRGQALVRKDNSSAPGAGLKINATQIRLKSQQIRWWLEASPDSLR